MRSGWVGNLGVMLIVGLGYFAGAWLGVTQTITPEGIAILWPPNAVALAALLILPVRRWPWVVPAVLAAEFVADVPAFPPWAAIAFGLVNLLEVFLAAALIRGSSAGSFDFDRLSRAARFVLYAPVLASALAAVLGAGVYLLLGRGETGFLFLWRTWWFGDALGLLLLTPPLVVFWRWLEGGRRDRQGSRFAELALVWAAIVGLGLLAFSAPDPYLLTVQLSPVVLLPFVIWAAVRFGVPGAAATVVLVAALAIFEMVHGHAPFGDLPANYAVWVVQEYLAVVALLGTGLAILLHEIEQQRLQLRLQGRAMRDTNDAIVIADARRPDRPITWVNAQFEALFGYTAEEAVGRNCRFLNAPEPDQPGLDTVREALAEDRACRAVVRNYRKSGEPLWIELSIAPVTGQRGEITHFVGVQHDLTEQKRIEDELREAHAALTRQNAELEERVSERTRALREANARLEELASTDRLTGIANRWHFLELAERELDRRRASGEPLALVMLDLDHFKGVNDRYGHLAGDRALAALAECVRATIRPLDLCGRFGGEEFLVLLPGIDAEGALHIAERLRSAIAATPVEFDGQAIPIAASLGVAAWDGRSGIDDLIRRADEALYRAKAAGRNRVVATVS